MEWVHGNIAAFGGDPERISLFGQSAGSTAVDVYTFAHPQDTVIKGLSFYRFGKALTDIIFAGVIEESGTYVLFPF